MAKTKALPTLRNPAVGLGNRPACKVTKPNGRRVECLQQFLDKFLDPPFFHFFIGNKKTNQENNTEVDRKRERESWMNGPPARPRPRWFLSIYSARAGAPLFIHISWTRSYFPLLQWMLYLSSSPSSNRRMKQQQQQRQQTKQKRTSKTLARLEGRDACLWQCVFIHRLVAYYARFVPHGHSFQDNHLPGLVDVVFFPTDTSKYFLNRTASQTTRRE